VNAFEYIEVTDVRVVAQPGSNLSACLQEVAVLACKERRNVILSLNGRTYSARYVDLIDAIKEIK
jgi:hypothetical protein